MKTLEKKIGYIFKDTKLLEVALRHRSVGKTSNERMEFLGDAILNFVIAAALFRKYPHEREGTLSRLRSNLVKRDALEELAGYFDLGEYLQLGIGERKSGGHSRPSILANAVEALIGAIYLDDGIFACEKIILNWYEQKLATLSLDRIKDPKSELQEYLQAIKKDLPVYEIINTEGKIHEQTFYVKCSVFGIDFATEGAGPSRRKAEQIAAENFLQKLKDFENEK
ncbi:MAG: ribonuclease III [Gammaproteobacteria bacterium]|nr:ribonuclease III [Gammaproteobacteria bacterium]